MTIRRQLDIAQLHVAARALGRTAGSGARGWTLWRFGAGTLEIEHAGVAYTLDAPGDGVGNGRTGEPSITSVVGELPDDGTVVVEVKRWSAAVRRRVVELEVVPDREQSAAALAH